MAEKFDKKALRNLMALVMGRLKVHSPGELAVKLGRSATRPHGVRTVQNWINGESGPEYASLMAMLSKAHLLAEEAEAIWQGGLAEEAAKAEGAVGIPVPERPARGSSAPKRGRR